MKVVLESDLHLSARVDCECGRYIRFRPGSDLTVPDVFRAAEHALYGCACQVEKRRQEEVAIEADLADLRFRLSAP